jgi:hypothetical protein
MQNEKPNVAKVIWMALLGSSFMYLFVAKMSAEKNLPEGEVPAEFNLAAFTSPADPLPMILLAVSSLILALAPKLQQMLLGSKSTPNSAFVPWIIRVALYDAICIFGLTVVFTKHSFAFGIPYFILGIAAIAMCNPEKYGVVLNPGSKN